MANPKILSVINKIIKKKLNFGDSLSEFRKATKGKFTAEEIAEGRKELLLLYTAPTNTRLLNLEDKYAMENPYVQKLDESLMQGQQQITQRALRDHYNQTFNRAQSSAADAIRPRIISATSTSKVRMVPSRRGRPTNFGVASVNIPGNNKVLQLDNLERKMIEYGYESLTPQEQAFITNHNLDTINKAFVDYNLPNAPLANIDMNEARTDVILNSLHGKLSNALFGLYLTEDGLNYLAKNILGIGAPLTLASYLMDKKQ